MPPYVRINGVLDVGNQIGWWVAPVGSSCRLLCCIQVRAFIFITSHPVRNWDPRLDVRHVIPQGHRGRETVVKHGQSPTVIRSTDCGNKPLSRKTHQIGKDGSQDLLVGWTSMLGIPLAKTNSSSTLLGPVQLVRVLSIAYLPYGRRP